MFHKCKSYGDLNLDHFRHYSTESLDSIQDHIDMNPNGTDILPTESSGYYVLERHTNLLREHRFKLKANFHVANCVHCKKRLGFGMDSLQCRVCPTRCHVSCYFLLKVNCIPQPVMNTKRGYLSDFAPTVAPRVPALIVHCVTEIEARGLQQEGLYRLSSTKEKCKRLKQKFLRGKTTPHLGDKDVHTLCCCIKDFLRSLINPLIPIYNRRHFVAATQQRDAHLVEQQVYQAVNALQLAHRDTLAFLMQHWQRVANSPAVKMSTTNIAVIFAPTIFDDVDLSLSNVMIWQQVLRKLLHMPQTFWTQFLEVEPAPSLDEDYDEREQRLRWGSVKTYFRSMVNLSA